MSGRKLIKDETTTLPDGGRRRIMSWDDGSSFESVTLAGTFPAIADRKLPVDMTRVTATQINRLECEARSEQDRADLESRWDEQWGS